MSVLKKSLIAARAESAELLREISERRCHLESLSAEANVVERELNVLRAKHAEGRQLLDKLEVCHRLYTLIIFPLFGKLNGFTFYWSLAVMRRSNTMEVRLISVIASTQALFGVLLPIFLADHFSGPVRVID